MKKPNDAKIVEYLRKRVMKHCGFMADNWNPLERLQDAWAMHSPMREGKVHEYPLYLTLADDGGIYYRATVHHQYDFTTITSCVDYENPCRAITMAVYEALKILDKGKKWKREKFWQMYRKPETPKIGVGVMLRRKNEVLLGLRKGSHGEGQWSLPGGHMELGEDFADTCARETKEETGIVIQGVKKLGFVNTVFEDDGLHYVTLFFEALWDKKQEAQLCEPDKTVEWKWFKPTELPKNLFAPLIKFLSGC